MDRIKSLKNLKKLEGKNTECYKCGAKGIPVYEDPNIEDMYFCEKCWEERLKTEEIEDWGFEEEIPYE
ncbi:hypothetical protein [Persephonella sp.]|uniref:hypothetical protein n=1 Tax=Persephonella sp. TaxID=2060922 RepID=UPI002637447B|nr:hypothetical protein [Persephonella sp.]